MLTGIGLPTIGPLICVGSSDRFEMEKVLPPYCVRLSHPLLRLKDEMVAEIASVRPLRARIGAITAFCARSTDPITWIGTAGTVIGEKVTGPSPTAAFITSKWTGDTGMGATCT